MTTTDQVGGGGGWWVPGCGEDVVGSGGVTAGRVDEGCVPGLQDCHQEAQRLCIPGAGMMMVRGASVAGLRQVCRGPCSGVSGTMAGFAAPICRDMSAARPHPVLYPQPYPAHVSLRIYSIFPALDWVKHWCNISSGAPAGRDRVPIRSSDGRTLIGGGGGWGGGWN